MTEPLKAFDINDLTAETGLVGGDAYYTGDKRVEWVQPDPGDDSGYWQESDIPDRTPFSAPPMSEILDRLEAIEKELKIRKK